MSDTFQHWYHFAEDLWDALDSFLPSHVMNTIKDSLWGLPEILNSTFKDRFDDPVVLEYLTGFLSGAGMPAVLLENAYFSRLLRTVQREFVSTLVKSNKPNKPVKKNYRPLVRPARKICKTDNNLYHLICDRVWDLDCNKVDAAQAQRLADDAKICVYLRQTAIERGCSPANAGHFGAITKVTKKEECLRKRIPKQSPFKGGNQKANKK